MKLKINDSKEKEGMSNYSKILNRYYFEGDHIKKFEFLNGFICGMETIILFDFPNLNKNKQRDLQKYYFKQIKKLKDELFKKTTN